MEMDTVDFQIRRRKRRGSCIFLSAAALIAAMLPANAYNGKQVNAKAVSIQSFYTGWYSNYSACGSGDNRFDGSILLYTIEAAKVTHKDTIYNRTLGLAHYAAFNLAGTRVAFYRSGQAPASPPDPKGGCVSVNGGKSYISVINADGTGLTDLYEIPALSTPNSGGIFPLDWPAGDWIYFTRPHDAAHNYNGDNASTMIWRVNSITKAAESVCNLTKEGNGAELVCSYNHRFSLSLAHDKMALMLYPKYACTADAGIGDVNSVYNFPPGSCKLASAIGGRAGCNISISPSGTQLGSYFAGYHDDLFLNNTDIKISQLESWAGEKIGNGAECIRWAVNSDKWVLQGIGLTNSGHASNNMLGCNSIVCNWVDQVAINISKNPAPYICAVDYMNSACPGQKPATTLDQSLVTNNDPGDMWISDPANNPNGDRYEDLQGVWHTVNGIAVSSDRDRMGIFELPNGSIIVNGTDRKVAMRLPSEKASEIRIMDIRGETMARLSARGQTQISMKSFAPGTYFVIVNNECMVKNFRFVVR